MNYRLYVISTIGYMICAGLGLGSAIYFAMSHRWFLFVIALLFTYVSVDNFFCGTRLAKTGCPVHKHYILPPFLKFR
jgi:hypothetical protein